MRNIIVFFFSFIFLNSLHSQQFYISSDSKIYTVDLATCQKTLVCDYTSKIKTGGFEDIALGPDGSVFAITIDGSLYELFLSNCTFKLLGKYPKFGNSLVCDNKGFLYSGIAWLMVYNPITKTFSDLGNFPNGWSSSGDFTFRKGKMYMVNNLLELIEIDKNNLGNSKIVFPISSNNKGIWGLFTIPVSCDSAETYCTFGNGTISKLNFQTKTIDSLCNLGILIAGATCGLEFISSDCALTVDLDLNNSSGVFPYDYQDQNACFNVDRPICDTNDVMVACYNKIDSITIFLNNPIDGNAEYLNATPTIDINVKGSGTHNISLINNGAALPADFSSMIKSMYYRNTSSQATAGTRTISFLAFSMGDTSKVAIAFIPLSQGISAGKDTSISICEKGTPIDLSKYISGSAGGTWSLANGIFTPGIDKEGSYYYITQSPICGPDTAVINITEVKLPNYVLDSVILKCDSSQVFLHVFNTIDNNVTWQDGKHGVTYTAKKSGLYYFIADNGYGCTLKDTTKVILSKPHEALYDFVVPPNQTSWVFNNISYTRDTIFCNPDGLKTYLGCDSIFCVVIKFSNVESSLNIDICSGGTYFFSGQYITQAGIYYDTLTSVNNKDSIISLNLNVIQGPDLVINGQEYICIGQEILLQANSSKNVNFSWQDGSTNSDYTVKTAMQYSVTATDSKGCSAIASIDVKPSPPLDYIFEVKNADCITADNGSIQPKEVLSGTEPIKYELTKNGQIIADFTNLIAGNYNLKGIDSNGCEKNYDITIEQLIAPIVDLGPDIIINDGDSIWLKAGPSLNLNGIYEWNPQDLLIEQIENKAKFVLNSSENISVKLIDSNGCEAIDDINVLIKEKLKVYIPNAFSPNNDGINDKFTIYADPDKWLIENLSIYDRWGEMVFTKNDFEPSDPSLGWNGKFHDKQMNTGVFVYYAVVRSKSGQIYELKGDVTVFP